MSGPHQWSTTPLANQTADARAPFPEGQPASSLNNGIRGAMATGALARDDNLGVALVATKGSGNAYTLTTGQGLIDPASIAGGGAPKITKPFSLKFTFDVAPTGMATTPPTLAIDGAAAVPIVRLGGAVPIDGDIVTGQPYEILGDTVVSGAVSRVRVVDPLPSDIAAVAQAVFSTLAPGIAASITAAVAALCVAKTGDTMTGDLQITKSYPQTALLWPGVIRAGWMLDSDGSVMWRNADSGAVYARIRTNGAIETSQIGDLNARIESRASAYASAAINNAVTSGRWVFAGQKSCFDQPGTGGFISPFGGHTMSCDYWTYQFLDANGIVQCAPFAYRYRAFQIYIANQGWVTCGAAS